VELQLELVSGVTVGISGVTVGISEWSYRFELVSRGYELGFILVTAFLRF
jgi:hypothetical protein